MTKSVEDYHGLSLEDALKPVMLEEYHHRRYRFYGHCFMKVRVGSAKFLICDNCSLMVSILRVSFEPLRLYAINRYTMSRVPSGIPSCEDVKMNEALG